MVDITPVPINLSQAKVSLVKAQQANDHENVSKNLQTILSWEPWRKGLWQRIGHAELSAQHPQEAAQAFLKAAENGENLSPQDQLAWGEAYWQTDNKTEAIDTWNKIITSEVIPTEVLQRVYDYQYTNQEYENALQTLLLWAKKEPDNALFQYHIGLLLSLSEPRQAQTHLTKAKNLDNSYTKKVNTLYRAISLAMQEEDVSYQKVIIGRALGAIHHWDLAEYLFEEAAQTSPQYSTAWAYLGEAIQHNGKDGLTELQKAQSLDPDSILIKALFSLYWQRQGEYDQALSILNSLTANEPENGLWQVEIGNIYAQQGELSTALQHYQKATKIEPENHQFYQIINRFCVTNNYQVETTGLDAARTALKLSNNSPQALDLIGWTMMHLEDFESAKRFYTMSLEKDANNSTTHLHLGQLYLLENNQSLAKQHLSQAALLSSDDEETDFLANKLLETYYTTSSQ